MLKRKELLSNCSPFELSKISKKQLEIEGIKSVLVERNP
jgi:hypothetical protein